MSSSRFTARYCPIVAFLLVFFIAGCGHEPVRRVADGRGDPVSAAAGSRSPGAKAAIAATRQIGVPYRYGGNTTRGFDCSGLVQYAWARAGVRIPRTTRDQWKQISPVRMKDLATGDLLFFRIDGRVSHVGMYLGGGRFVHAPSTGRRVSVATLESDFYRRTFVGAARP